MLGMAGGQESDEDPNQELRAKADKWVPKTWEQVKNSYWVYHQRIWEARLFYSGQFYFDFDVHSRRFEQRQPNDDFVPQPRMNRFSPAIDSIASNFVSIPEVEAVPVPRDDERSMAICEIVNELAQHAIKDNALRSDYKGDEDKAGYAAMEFVLSGCCYSIVRPQVEVIGQRPRQEVQQAFAYQCPTCDIYQTAPEPVEACPQCGGPVQVDQTEQVAPVMGPDGQPEMEDVTRTRIVVELGDPGHSFPRLGAHNMKESPYHFWAQRFTLEEIRKRWNYEATADSSQPDGFNVALDQALSFWMVGYNSASDKNGDAALVVQCYVEPDRVKDFPQGLYAVMIADKVIYAEPWTFVEHPLTKADYIQIPGLFFPRSISSDLVELQRRKCTYESLIELHAKTSAVDPLVIDENTVTTRPTGRADKIIYWRSLGAGSKEPHRMGHGVLDPQVYARLDYIDQQFDIISAVSSVFRGEQPGSVTAASAIQTLRSQAEMRFAKPVNNWIGFWKETIRKVVKNYQRHMTLPELVEICGEEMMMQVQEFMACDLDKCAEFIATNNGLPRTRDERRQEMLTLFDRGALDPADPNVRQKIFELFGETGMMKSFNDDARRARVNVKRIKTGEPVMFRPGIDDPMVHLGIALEAAKALDFESWPPEAQQFLMEVYIPSIRMTLQPPEPPPEDGAPEGNSKPSKRESPDNPQPDPYIPII